MSLPSLRALRSPNFRRYLLGQGPSLVGTWMQQLAMSWLVFRLTGSSQLLGVAVFCSQIPMLVLSPFAGVLADRWDKRRLILITQTLLMAQAATLAVLSASGAVRVWHVMVLNLAFGIVNSLDMPSRQSLVADLIERRDDLSNAIALNATAVNVTRLVGPALAGLVIAAFGEAVCFALNALSFLAVIGALLSMKLKPSPAASRARTPVLRGFRDGLVYAFGFEPIGALLALLAMVSLLSTPYTVLMPIFATDVLEGGPHTMGFLTAFSGSGALAGALYLASHGTVRGLLRPIAYSAALFGAGLMAFSFSTVFAVSAAALFASGFGVMVMMAATNTVLQTVADDDKRGRVMSLYVTSLMGISPLGALAAGAAAERWGAQMTVAVGGACSLAAAGLFALRIPSLRRKVRPVYASKGVAPHGLEAAAEIGGRLKQ